MEFADAVRQRRMVRNYTDEPVDPAAVDRILQAALRAPSAGNSQGHSFVVVTDEGARRRIAELAGEPDYVRKGFDPWVSQAPVHVVLCVDPEAYRERYRAPDKTRSGDPVEAWPVPYWWVDAGASMMLLLMAAVDEGLAAGFLGAHAIPGLAAELGIPDDVDVIGLVTIGHGAPDRTTTSEQRGRRDVEDLIHRGTWGGASPPAGQG